MPKSKTLTFLLAFAVGLAVIVFGFRDAAAASDCDFPPPIDAVVKVMRGTVGGTGFLISPTEVMTPNHVVAGGIPESIEVGGKTRELIGIQVHPGLLDGVVDKGEDVVILTIEPTDTSFLELASEPVREYERVVAIGYPRSMSVFVVEGLTQKIDEDGDLWTSLHALDGMSGSPIIACRDGWQVVGMITGMLLGLPKPPFGQQSRVYFISLGIAVGELRKVPRA